MAQYLTIPPQYQGGLAKLARLSPNATYDLVSALGDAPPSLNPVTLSSELASRVSTISSEDLAEIVPALQSLYSLRAQLGASTPLVASSILEAMENSGIQELVLSPEEEEGFQSRLVDLLSIEAFEMGEKANNLLYEHERVLREVRILTDVRPVFGSDPDALPEGAIVVHSLKIGHFEGSSYKELYFTLDEGDVSIFRTYLERADRKAESLRSMLRSAGVPPVDTK